MTRSKAFEPVKVGRLELGHRVAMAPLTRMRADEKTQALPDVAVEYYEQRACRPGTLIIAEAAFISPESRGYPKSPGMWTKPQLDQWKKVFDAIHAKGCFVYAQLIAMGRVAPEGVVGKGNVVGPSAVAAAGEDQPRALTEQEIQQYVRDFATAAKNAVQAGADGVEIHAGNGYLVDQFLHENSNVRTDKYGGSIENRARFALEVIDAISQAIGPDRTAVRFSPWGEFGDVDYGVSAVPQWSYLAAELEKRRIAGKELGYVHLIEPRVGGNDDRDKKDHESNDFFRLIYGGMLMRAGALADMKLIDDLVTKDQKALVALGRYFVSNPDLIDRLEKGIPLTKYHRPTFYSSGLEGYIDYPFFES